MTALHTDGLKFSNPPTAAAGTDQRDATLFQKGVSDEVQSEDVVFCNGCGSCDTAVIPSAEARSTTGWNSFRVWSPLGADQCVAESFGAAVNRCNFDINLTFELVVDNPGWKSVKVWDAPGGYGAFTCGAVEFSGVNNDIDASEGKTFNPEGQEKLEFLIYVYPGDGLSLYCFNVPPGKGISNINWNP